jgi:hypothetical protein
VIKEFEALVQVQYKASIKRWHVDAGGEFLNFDLLNMLKSLGIMVEQSLPYQHQKNGCAERAIRTTMEKAQALSFMACLLPSFWEFTVEHSVLLHN